MNEETIAAFKRFESLLSRAVNKLHESLQETNSLNTMYLDQFNDIVQFKQKTQAFTHFLKEENEYHNTKYAQFKSKMNTESIQQSFKHCNYNENDIISTNVSDITDITDNNNTISININEWVCDNKLQAHLHKLIKTDMQRMSIHENTEIMNATFESLNNAIDMSNNIINACDIENQNEIEIEHEHEHEHENEMGLISDNVSFIKGQQPPITFIEYEAPYTPYNKCDHPHYHPSIHGNEGIQQQQQNEREQQRETAMNGEATPIDMICGRDKQLFIKHKIATFAQHQYQILLWLIKLNHRINMNNSPKINNVLPIKW